MARFIRVLGPILVTVAILFLGGCLDVVQYVSGTATEIDVYFRLTLQKSVFELANSMSDQAQDLESMFGEFNLEEGEVLNEMPEGVRAEYAPINSTTEFGFELSYTAPRDLLDGLEDDEAAFVPRVSPWGLSIPLNEGEGDGSDQFADAFLGSTKYRLMISKRLVSRVSSARIVTGDESIPVTITELPDLWLVEFPVNQWFSAAGAPTLEVRF